jgi:hypothetical protein
MQEVMNLNVETATPVSATEALGLAAGAGVFPIIIQADLLPETVALLQRVAIESKTASQLVIQTAGDLQIAGDQLQRIKGMTKSINEQRLQVTKPFDDAKKKVMDYVAAPLAALAEVENSLKNAILECQTRLDNERREEEARQQEKARKEQEALERKAEKAEESGKVERAEALREQAASVVAAPAPVASTKVAGVSTRWTFGAEVIDLKELALSVACGLLADEAEGDANKLMALVNKRARNAAPLQAIAADTKFIDKQAKAFKEAFAMPGVKLTKTPSVASRAK